MMVDSHSHNNLRDFLRIRDEDHHHHQQQQSGEGSQRRRRRSNCSGITLLAMLAETRERGGPSVEESSSSSSSSSTRTITLLDIIRQQDPNIHNVGARGGRSWRQLRDRIRLSAPPLRPSNSQFTSSNNPHPSEGEEERGREEQPGRTSLMALLENDWQQLRPSSTNTLRQEMMEEEEEEEREIVNAAASWVEEEDEEEKHQYSYSNNNNRNGNGNSCCCVCMVRHKGAAFIPCGHTFCRVCSRHLWLNRGLCPLCNIPILEVLHIF